MSTALDNIAPIGHDRLEQVYGEVPVERVKPPHHLLETQIFSHLQKNDIFQVEPEQLSFLVNKVRYFSKISAFKIVFSRFAENFQEY